MSRNEQIKKCHSNFPSSNQISRESSSFHMHRCTIEHKNCNKKRKSIFTCMNEKVSCKNVVVAGYSFLHQIECFQRKILFKDNLSGAQHVKTTYSNPEKLLRNDHPSQSSTAAKPFQYRKMYEKLQTHSNKDNFAKLLLPIFILIHMLPFLYAGE